jgi:hypothetical protein
MVRGWSSSSTQRFTSASSISSISSKSELATPSLVNGHSLSAGYSSEEPFGRNSRCIPSGSSSSLPVCQPAWSKTTKTLSENRQVEQDVRAG